MAKVKSARLALLVGTALALLLAAVSIQRVPEGSSGVRAGGVAGPGWGLVPPWDRATIVPSAGTVALDGLAIRTPEGSSLGFRLEAGYRLGTKLSSRFSDDLRARGLEAAIRDLATSVLDDAGMRWDAESILSDPGRVEAAARVALEASGVAIDRLSLRSTLGDEVLTRRRTAEARELARPMLGRRLLVVGWDGADWKTIRPLVASGRMPNLARVMREGAWGDLRSYDPMFSPLLWTTVATGKPPTQHGIADFLIKDPATGKRRPITSEFRKTKALWNVLGDFDRDSGWIAWWASFPAEPIRGAMVTELLAFTAVRSGPEAAVRAKSLTHPEGYLATRQSLLVTPSTLRLRDVSRLFPVGEAEFASAVARAPVEQPDEKSKEPPDPVVFAVKLLCAMRTYHNLAVDMARQGPPIMSVYYEGIDMMGHRFQHYLPPKMDLVTAEEYARFEDAVPRYHELQDAMLGELLEAAGPDTNLVLLSDHGFRAGDDRPTDVAPYTTGQPAEWHAPWGILAMHGPSIRHVELPPASIYDVAPTLLYLAGLPLAEDMPGRLAVEAFRPEVVRGRPPARIKSFELVGAPIASRAPAVVDQEAMDEMMANLRALGYVGGEAEAGASPGGGAGAPPAAGVTETEAQTQVFYHRNLAVAHIKQGDLAAAERELLLANEREKLPKTYGLLAEIRATQGRFREAAAAIEEGFGEVPEKMDPDAVLWLVEMHLKAGDAAGARDAALRHAGRMGTGVAAAVEGRLAESDGDPRRARALYEAALTERPLLVSTLLRLRDLYAAAGEPAKIEPWLQRGVAANPKADAHHDMLGGLDLARGDAAGALEHFRRATEIQPENGLYLGHLAIAAAATGNRREAENALGWAERSDPREPDAWMAIGSAWDRLGKTERALAAFGKARERGLEGPGADLGSALVLARAGRTAEARRLIEETRRRFPASRPVEELARRLGA